MTVELLRRKFTVEKYHKMVDSGILTENDRVELIRGEIIEMSAIGTRHAAGVRRLDNLLSTKLQGLVIIDTQNPIELDDISEPQPDVALLRPRADFYANSHPQPDDIFLLIEVADTTVKYDREVKIPLYAENNIFEVWLVDVNQQIIEVYREPTKEGYGDMQKFTLNQSLSIQAFSDVSISVNEIFGLS
jgi:Uma2 family endonuclease